MTSVLKTLLRLLVATTFLSLFVATPSYTYNSEECSKTAKKIESKFFKGAGGDIPFITYFPSTWASQFTSSWGGCAAIGIREQRELFIATNSINLIADSARGSGEYIDALAELSGCHGVNAREYFGAALQKNFNFLYFNFVNSPEEINLRIDSLIRSQPLLKKLCANFSLSV